MLPNSESCPCTEPSFVWARMAGVAAVAQTSAAIRIAVVRNIVSSHPLAVGLLETAASSRGGIHSGTSRADATRQGRAPGGMRAAFATDAREGGREDALVAGSDAVPVEFVFGAPTGGRAEARAQGRVVEEALELLAQVETVAGVREQARLLVRHGFGNAAHAGGDDGHAGGHVLEHHVRVAGCSHGRCNGDDAAVDRLEEEGAVAAPQERDPPRDAEGSQPLADRL